MKSDRQSEAAIGRQGRAGDVARLIRAQEDNGASDSLRKPRPPQMNASFQDFVVQLVPD